MTIPSIHTPFFFFCPLEHGFVSRSKSWNPQVIQTLFRRLICPAVRLQVVRVGAPPYSALRRSFLLCSNRNSAKNPDPALQNLGTVSHTLPSYSTHELNNTSHRPTQNILTANCRWEDLTRREVDFGGFVYLHADGSKRFHSFGRACIVVCVVRERPRLLLIRRVPRAHSLTTARPGLKADTWLIRKKEMSINQHLLLLFFFIVPRHCRNTRTRSHHGLHFTKQETTKENGGSANVANKFASTKVTHTGLCLQGTKKKTGLQRVAPTEPLNSVKSYKPPSPMFHASV